MAEPRPSGRIAGTQGALTVVRSLNAALEEIISETEEDLEATGKPAGQAAKREAVDMSPPTEREWPDRVRDVLDIAPDSAKPDHTVEELAEAIRQAGGDTVRQGSGDELIPPRRAIRPDHGRIDTSRAVGPLEEDLPAIARRPFEDFGEDPPTIEERLSSNPALQRLPAERARGGAVYWVIAGGLAAALVTGYGATNFLQDVATGEPDVSLIGDTKSEIRDDAAGAASRLPGRHSRGETSTDLTGTRSDGRSPENGRDVGLRRDEFSMATSDILSGVTAALTKHENEPEQMIPPSGPGGGDDPTSARTKTTGSEAAVPAMAARQIVPTYSVPVPIPAAIPEDFSEHGTRRTLGADATADERVFSQEVAGVAGPGDAGPDQTGGPGSDGEGGLENAGSRPPSKQPELSAADITALSLRTRRLLDDGDIASARLLLEHLASVGHGESAEALARTFDPAYLPGDKASGLRPNIELAIKWYRIAVELGRSEARLRVRELQDE